MNITYKIYTGKDVKSAAQMVITNRLFVNTWCMRDDARIMVEREMYNDEKTIIIASHENKPIAACFLMGTEVQTFVRKKYRRKGIGRTMVKKAVGSISPIWKNNIHWGVGIEGSVNFYRQCGL